MFSNAENCMEKWIILQKTGVFFLFLQLFTSLQ